MAYKSKYTGAEIDYLLQQSGLNAEEIDNIKSKLENYVPGGGSEGGTGADGKDGVGIANIVQTTKSDEDDGINVITVTLTDGSSHTFEVQNGSRGSRGEKGNDGVSPTIDVNKVGKVTTIVITDANGTKTVTINDGVDGAAGEGGSGADGKDGIGIARIVQTTKSTEDGGINVLTITLTDGSTYDFEVQNGSKGSTGSPGSAGANGTSVTVSKVSESNTDGGSNIVTFSDGKTLTVKNGRKGDTGPAYTLTNTDKANIAAAVKGLLTTETWTFTLANGSTVTKKVVLG